VTGDPWNARTLEWSTPSPPPAWNFSHLPQVDGADAFWAMKQNTPAKERDVSTYEAVHVPRNNPTGFFLAFFAVLLGFSLIWQIWWGAGLGLLGAIVVCLMQAWRTDLEVEVPADEVAGFELRHRLRTRTS
jgi:cytochrome o ubiquinol oxidase subunit I